MGGEGVKREERRKRGKLAGSFACVGLGGKAGPRGEGLAAGLFFLRGLVQKSWGSGGGGGGGLALVGSQDSFPSFAWRLTSLEGGGGCRTCQFSVCTLQLINLGLLLG